MRKTSHVELWPTHTCRLPDTYEFAPTLRYRIIVFIYVKIPLGLTYNEETVLAAMTVMTI